MKGGLGTFLALGQLPYFRDMGVDAADYQIYGSIATTPWAMKALYGMLSDSVPLCGWHKRGYIIGVSVVGVAAVSTLAVVELPLEQASVAAMLFFVANLDMAMVDLLVQGKYAQMMVQHPDTSSDLVTWVVSDRSPFSSCMLYIVPFF